MRAFLALLVVIVAAVPLASSTECYSERVHGVARAQYILSPPPPPRAGVEAGGCVSTPYTGQVDDHRFLPNMTEVFIDYERDLGAGVPTVSVTLNGFGFTNASFPMTRQPAPLGNEFEYDMAGFVPIPDAPHETGTLYATVTFPGGNETGAFRVLSFP